VSGVSPSILADIRVHGKSDVETFLGALLSLCLPKEHNQNPPVNLLDTCIEAVLPICNAHLRPIETKRGQNRNELEKSWSGLRSHLTE
jgi:hypothetical protein